jgi:hypothetical protein
MHRNRRPENGNGCRVAAGTSASGSRRERSAPRRPAGAGQSPPATKDEVGFPGFLLPSPRGRRASEFLLATFGIPALALRGRLGDRVFKTYGDKIVITRVPRFEGYVPSAAQRDRRNRMRAATAYARAVYANPAAKAVYVASATQLGRQPFRLAVSDFLRGHTRVTLEPTTTREGQGGELILKPDSHKPPQSTKRKDANVRPGFAKDGGCGCALRRLSETKGNPRRSSFGLFPDRSHKQIARAAVPDVVMPEHVTNPALRVRA